MKAVRNQRGHVGGAVVGVARRQEGERLGAHAALVRAGNDLGDAVDGGAGERDGDSGAGCRDEDGGGCSGRG
jgi:hypothetical protein